MSVATTLGSIPRAGEARRVLQAKGQFWTPEWVAQAMAAYVLDGQPEAIFDPAVGAGAFFTACRHLGYTGRFAGYENDESALQQAYAAGLDDGDLGDVDPSDFFLGVERRYPGILSNPPYLRHHKIAPALKERLQSYVRGVLGLQIDGRAGLHVYFLLRCLEQLAEGGRLAFLLPADTFEGVFAAKLWNWVTRKFRLSTVVTFSPEAAPFQSVDTNAVIVTLERSAPQEFFTWARLCNPDGGTLRALLQHGAVSSADVEGGTRRVSEAVETGLTRAPGLRAASGPCLGDVAHVMRGIATGANEYFFLTSAQIAEHRLQLRWFKHAIGRVRDCPDDILDAGRLEALDRTGRPTWLLDLPDVSAENFPRAVRNYLDAGERLALPDRSLIRMRKRWYRMEQRTPPPILFAYLGRRSCRFILNRAGALPLTGFLCVYPHVNNGLEPESLWRLLNAPEALEGLAAVGKTYGSGAIKVEPRALERLPLPRSLCVRYGLPAETNSTQLKLMEDATLYESAGKLHKATTQLD